MEERVVKSEADASKLVTAKELYEICVQNEFKCAVSGHTCYFKSRDCRRTPYWSISLDHIDPLNDSKENPISWSKENIQPLCNVLNIIKGHVPNDELRLMQSKADASELLSNTFL